MTAYYSGHLFFYYKGAVIMEAVLSIEEILDEIRDLTSKEMTSESKNRVIKLGKNLLEVGIFALMNRGSNFYGTLLSNTNKNSTLALQAPAAVSHDKTSSRFYIHINPLLMANLCTKPSEVIAIIEHEAYHLMNMHLVIYSNMMKKGEKSRNRMNIGTDCYINQKIDNIPDGCVTVDTVREIALLKEDEIQENKEKLEKSGGKITVLDICPPEISSSMVRDAFLKGKDCSGFLNPLVLEHIRKNALYKGE